MRYEEEIPGEWQVDPKTGERFRMVGHIKEYEMMIHTSGGIVRQANLQNTTKGRKKQRNGARLRLMKHGKTVPRLKAVHLPTDAIPFVSVRAVKSLQMANAPLLPLPMLPAWKSKKHP